MPLDQKTLMDAVKEAREKSEKRKFTQSVELVINLKDIDMKSSEGKLQEIIELPYSAEKQNQICVIASGELALKAKKANADLLIERADLDALAGKKRDLRKIANKYDFFIAEAPLMPLVGKVLGPALGPRGKMPMPVPPTADIASLMEKHRKTVVVRMRTPSVLQCRVGAESLKDEELAENVLTVLRGVEGKLKRGEKNIKLIHLKTTMGKPVSIRP